jgi:4-amino-4-deoxy-L-arabinose transferase-like glycosyltransferase
MFQAIPCGFENLSARLRFFVLVLAWALIAMPLLAWALIAMPSRSFRPSATLPSYHSCIMSSPDVGWVLPAMPPTSHTTNINGITLWILEA